VGDLLSYSFFEELLHLRIFLQKQPNRVNQPVYFHFVEGFGEVFFGDGSHGLTLRGVTALNDIIR